MNKTLKEYRVEIIALLIALLGVLLLVGQFEIRQTVLGFFYRLKDSLVEFARGVDAAITNYINSFSLSDMLGWLLIFATLAFIAWRVRYRFLRSKYWNASACPRCNSKLRRSHRTTFERQVTKFLLPHGRRYSCTNEQCNWSGLRKRFSTESHTTHSNAKEAFD